MLQTKLQDNQPTGSKEDVLKEFSPCTCMGISAIFVM